MDQAYILGKMAEDTKDNITTTKRMGMAHTHGQTEEYMKGAGDRGNSNNKNHDILGMDQENIYCKTIQLKGVYGRMGKE